MKLEPGANKFRAIGDAITGYRWFVEKDEKTSVVRVKRLSGVPVAIRAEKNRVKHFWAFPVYNYGAEMVQILEIPQITVQTVIETYISNPDWGDPTNYDITITKKGEGWDTEYIVTPSPKRELTKEVKEQITGWHINMEALFTNGDPFEIKETTDPKEVIDPKELDIDKILGR
jgi:hypothetical protein